MALPERSLLNKVSPEDPVSLRRYCDHATFANTRALDIAGVTEETQDPDGGTILPDEHGFPSGVLVSATG